MPVLATKSTITTPSIDIDRADWLEPARPNTRRVFAAILHNLTREIKLSDRRLARLMRIKCGSRFQVHVNSVFYWRTGKRIPPPHMVQLLCETLSMPPDMTRHLHLEAARDYGYLIGNGGLENAGRTECGENPAAASV